ncbi:hypothetical protein BK120_20410 [Paenibacillus sp. FSL A5-0031]|uniref:hypothetical protein n=1 Tax=Paenibacillus sp. FSL A5-0031 TaxID=1920420 RepID=UPI00096CC9E3|nr:hypothetical protein [Paenibacillus sp. FSL A5-0031]OME80192.1 hypothetical protein BK120_20410 [Paenibacillus sp. FSL A5-0031]
MRPDHYKLMYEFVKWAGGHSHITGIALVGPCADDESEEDSNLSFLLVTDKKQKTVDAILYQFQYEAIEQATKEEYVLLTSLKIEYASGIEADFGVADTDWLHRPLEQGLGDLLVQGFKVIWEQEEMFDDILKAIARYAVELENGAL